MTTGSKSGQMRSAHHEYPPVGQTQARRSSSNSDVNAALPASVSCPTGCRKRTPKRGRARRAGRTRRPACRRSRRGSRFRSCAKSSRGWIGKAGGGGFVRGKMSYDPTPGEAEHPAFRCAAFAPASSTPLRCTRGYTTPPFGFGRGSPPPAGRRDFGEVRAALWSPEDDPSVAPRAAERNGCRRNAAQRNAGCSPSPFMSHGRSLGRYQNPSPLWMTARMIFEPLMGSHRGRRTTCYTIGGVAWDHCGNYRRSPWPGAATSSVRGPACCACFQSLSLT